MARAAAPPTRLREVWPRQPPPLPPGERSSSALHALARDIAFKPKVTWFLPVKLESGPRGELFAVPDPSNTSGDFAGLVGTDGFVELAPGNGVFPAGTVAPFYAWV